MRYVRLSILAMAILSTWYLTRDHYVKQHELQMSEIVMAGMQDVLAAQAQATQWEVEYNDQVRNANALARDNQRLTDELGMRDPFAAVCPTAPQPAECPACRPCDGKLSKQASQFLLDLTREADELRAYANTCYKWIQELAH